MHNSNTSTLLGSKRYSTRLYKKKPESGSVKLIAILNYKVILALKC